MASFLTLHFSITQPPEEIATQECETCETYGGGPRGDSRFSHWRRDFGLHMSMISPAVHIQPKLRSKQRRYLKLFLVILITPLFPSAIAETFVDWYKLLATILWPWMILQLLEPFCTCKIFHLIAASLTSYRFLGALCEGIMFSCYISLRSVAYTAMWNNFILPFTVSFHCCCCLVMEWHLVISLLDLLAIWTISELAMLIVLIRSCHWCLARLSWHQNLVLDSCSRIIFLFSVITSAWGIYGQERNREWDDRIVICTMQSLKTSTRNRLKHHQDKRCSIEPWLHIQPDTCPSFKQYDTLK